MKPMTPEERQLIERECSDLLCDPRVLLMKRFCQHGSVTTYDHVLRVTLTALRWSRQNRNIHLRRLLRAALLHDFYLYDWHTPSSWHKRHGYHHAARAAANADRYFQEDEHTLSMIRSHMWPLNITRIPKSREAWLLTMADKWCSFGETFIRKNPPK